MVQFRSKCGQAADIERANVSGWVCRRERTNASAQGGQVGRAPSYPGEGQSFKFSSVPQLTG